MARENYENPAQYLLDYLADLEQVIEKHAQITYRKKYLIYRDGYLYTGTNEFSDVLKVVNAQKGLYTYKVNQNADLEE
ncbi:hypothetical protein [Reichenbachiella versicolor]|uniref:hypothetical protein n=1 Tax=Reichenbachiella versicolor TaxID=1821036 RepID=UPI000D6E8746|nr:hypothetical protein [Reichenbachiella versicolor]